MNRGKTSIPKPIPILNLASRTNKSIIQPNTSVQPHTTRSVPNASLNGKRHLEPLSARPIKPESILDENETKNPRFRFFVPPTYQSKNLPPRISPIISNAPITPQLAIAKYSSLLTPFELTEILDFPEIYFVGFRNKKININLSDTNGFGFDDHTTGYYKANPGDHIIYRFEIQSILGQGTHGQVLKCYDHKTQQECAIKVLANTKQAQSQIKTEMTILSRLKKLHPDGIDTAQIYFVFRTHTFITFNIFSKNVFQLMALNEISDLSPRLVRCIAMDVINQMVEYQSVGVTIHGQILPENILLIPNTNAEFKLIDFSNAILNDEFPNDYKFEVPHSFMPPECLLNLEVHEGFDMWCLGCLLALLTLGNSLFEGKDDPNLLNSMIEVIGAPNSQMKKKIPAAKRQEMFDKSTGGIKKALLSGTGKSENRSLKDVFNGSDQEFMDFLSKIFVWDQENRLTAADAMNHPYIANVDARIPEPETI